MSFSATCSQCTWQLVSSKAVLKIFRAPYESYPAAGIVLVVTGAVLIGMFGGAKPLRADTRANRPTDWEGSSFAAVPEPTHTLNELIALYRRPAFIVWISLLILAVLIVIALAHLAEWNLERHTTRLSSPVSKSRVRIACLVCMLLQGRIAPDRSLIHTFSALVQHPVTTLYGTNGFSRSTATVPLISDQEPSLAPPTSGRGPASHREQHDVHDRGRNPLFSSSIILEDEATSQAARSLSNERTRLVLGIAYAAVAGALSGLCLLFTKTSLELLILTLGGKNQVSQTCPSLITYLRADHGNSFAQFGRIEAWIILLTLVVAEFTQVRGPVFLIRSPTQSSPLSP